MGDSPEKVADYNEFVEEAEGTSVAVFCKIQPWDDTTDFLHEHRHLSSLSSGSAVL
jgi:hypothetical protein